MTVFEDSVMIYLDRPRFLRYSLDSVIELHRLVDFGTITMRNIKYIVWAGLLHEDPDLQVEDVSKILDNIEVERLPEISESVNEAMDILHKRLKRLGMIKGSDD